MLSKRLQALADFIPADQIVADIGCDHALLLCRLAETGRLKKGYAIDVAVGPLRAAARNIATGKHDNIMVITAAGLKALPPDTTVVVIAGLGYRTIRNILADDWDKLQNINEVVVQCNAEITKFREFLSQRQVNITAEKWVKDRHDYQLVKFDLRKKRVYRDSETYFGPFLLQEKTSEFLAYYRRHYQKLLFKYDLSKDPEVKRQLTLIEDKLKDLF